MSRIPLILFSSVLLCAGQPHAAEPGLPLLTTALQVRQLSPTEAGRAYPVRLNGVVLYFRQGKEFCELIVQDKTLGIFVRTAPSNHHQLTAGDIVQIEGVTDPGKFAPMILLSNLRLRGHGPLPPARDAPYEQLLTGIEDCQWVTVHGVVRTAANVIEDGSQLMHMDLVTPGGRIWVRLPRLDPSMTAPLIGAKVSVTGSCATIFNNRRQLLNVRLSVQNIDQIVVESPAPIDPTALPVQTVNSLHQYNSQAIVGHLVKVQGVVLFHEPNKSVFIRDDTQALWIQARQAGALAIGDRIEAMGFPASKDYSPILEDATYRRIGSAAAPIAIPMTADEGRKGQFANDLVRVEAQLLDSFPSPNEQILVLQEGNVVFRASLAKANAASFNLPPVRSRLRLTGICLVDLGRGPYPQSFHLVLRTPADVRVLAQPPWWTVSRLLWALGATASLFIAALVWVVTLRRRVRHQTAIIQEKIKRAGVLEERTRIARDFHDTLEQQLAAIALQIQVIRARFESSPDFARRVLQVVESMLRHTRAEARHSVWDLRARALENGSLCDALSTMANYVRNGFPVEVDVQVCGDPRPLTGQIENNLLRIGQEAATNAVKHGAAKHVQIRLSYDPDAVQLSVEDDGKGFEIESAPAGQTGHFGLLGMRERAEKIGGHLQLASAPGRGARVGVVVPLQPAE